MYLARVVGKLWASEKNANYVGVPLLVVQPLNERFEPQGDPEVAIDSLSTGEDEIVWVEGGKEASYAFPSQYGPSDASIVGKIEHLDVAVPAPAGVAVRLPGAAA